jgi:ABC-2 type transport system permease protein
VFFPLASLPGWVQGVAQAFPIYWLGLGMRSALLPDFGPTANYLPIVGVLAAWAVAGLLLAPIALRRVRA